MRSTKPGNHLKQHKRHAFWFVSVELFKVKKYPQRRKILVKLFVSELNLRSWKTWKGLGKSHEIWTAQKSTNPVHNVIRINELCSKRKKKKFRVNVSYRIYCLHVFFVQFCSTCYLTDLTKKFNSLSVTGICQPQYETRVR